VVVVGGNVVVDGGAVVGCGGAVVVGGTTVVVVTDTVRHFGCVGRDSQNPGFGLATTPAANTPIRKNGTKAKTRRTSRQPHSSQTAYTWHACPVPFSTTTPTPFAAPAADRIPESPNVQITPAPIAAPRLAR
jgi:hypothetical protein